MATLADYEAAAGKDAVHEIATIAARLKGLRVVNVNSTAVGGGVAEILMRMVPLLQELGVDARWEVIKGDAAFYETTKAITTRCTASRSRSPTACGRRSSTRRRATRRW